MEILNCQDAIELDPRICVILNAEDVQAGNALGARTEIKRYLLRNRVIGGA